MLLIKSGVRALFSKPKITPFTVLKASKYPNAILLLSINEQEFKNAVVAQRVINFLVCK